MCFSLSLSSVCVCVSLKDSQEISVVRIPDVILVLLNKQIGLDALSPWFSDPCGVLFTSASFPHTFDDFPGQKILPEPKVLNSLQTSQALLSAWTHISSSFLL